MGTATSQPIPTNLSTSREVACRHYANVAKLHVDWLRGFDLTGRLPEVRLLPYRTANWVVVYTALSVNSLESDSELDRAIYIGIPLKYRQ
jgi:hypothetical protein